jgi:hypothetical protein
MSEIRKHEREAIQHLIASGRAMASMLNEINEDDLYVQKLLAWANIAEQFLDQERLK